MNTNCFWKERRNPLDSELEAQENFWNNIAPNLPGVRRLDPNVDRTKIAVNSLVSDMADIFSPIPARRVN